MSEKINVIQAQKGFQEACLSCSADIAFFGGAAGCGKTTLLLLEGLRNTHNRKFRCVTFRRESVQITNAGSIWDASKEMYSQLPPSHRPTMTIPKSVPTHTFPNGSSISFNHINQENDVFSWQGSEIDLIQFDELTHFSSKQFWYMTSRNRSTSGVKPYIRATMNPQGEGWVKDMIAWYLYPDDYADESLAGYPILERAGVIRYFTRFKDMLIWGNNPNEVIEQLPDSERQHYTVDLIKSFTFIPGLLSDNMVFVQKDPSYRANLLALDDYDRAQLLGGRWLKASDDVLRLLNTDAIKDIFTNDFVRGGQKYITADIALEGNDSFTVGVWDGWRLFDLSVIPKSDGKEVLEFIKKKANQYSVPQRNIAFDADGVGGFLTGFFRTSIAFHGNGTPIKIFGETQNYENLRAQVHYYLQKMVNNYECYADISPRYAALLEEELKAILKAATGSNGKLSIIPKAQIKLTLKRSPDLSDMFALRSVFDLMGRGTEGGRKTSSR